VNAFLVQIVLVSSNAVGLHALLVGVAVGASSWQILWMDARHWISHILDGVSAVAIVTGGRVLIPLSQTLAVHALFVIA
jgi:hypothetical protein